MNNEGHILAGRALGRERDKYGCKRRVWIEERLEERKGRPWREMRMNGSEQAGECVRLLNRKCVNIAQPTLGVESRHLFLSTGHSYIVRGSSGRLRVKTILIV